MVEPPQPLPADASNAGATTEPPGPGDDIGEGESFGEHHLDRGAGPVFEGVAFAEGDDQVDRGGVHALVPFGGLRGSEPASAGRSLDSTR